MEAQTSMPLVDAGLELAKLLQDPVLILLLIVLIFFMVIIKWMRTDTKDLVDGSIDDLAEQVDIMADEIKTMGEALMELTMLFKTLSLLRGKGVANVKIKEDTTGTDKIESKKNTSKGFPN